MRPERWLKIVISRGEVYLGWTNPAFHVRSVIERMPDGTLLDVQARMSVFWETQLFIGIYGDEGEMLFEEVFDCRSRETITQALDWGLNRARAHSPIGRELLKKCRHSYHPMRADAIETLGPLQKVLKKTRLLARRGKQILGVNSRES